MLQEEAYFYAGSKNTKARRPNIPIIETVKAMSFLFSSVISQSAYWQYILLLHSLILVSGLSFSGQLPDAAVSQPHPAWALFNLRMSSRIIPRRHPTPLVTTIASWWQFNWQPPHSIHLSALARYALLFSISITRCGHTLAQVWQPVQLF
jgi:hypothetical protein